MAEKSKTKEKLFDSVSVQRVQQFGALGSRAEWVYIVTATTVNGNSGQFRLKASEYEDDKVYLEKLQEIAFQLDKHLFSEGVM
jgi:hypothetical protein